MSKFTCRFTRTEQPSLSTLCPAGVVGHLSTEFKTPSLSLSPSTGAATGAGFGAGAGSGFGSGFGSGAGVGTGTIAGAAA